MDYELAKKLKDVGFSGYFGDWDSHDQDLLQKDWEIYKSKYSPTLSELIGACVGMNEDGDFHLEHLYDEWGAATCHSHKERDDWERGKTPEESVARLWLELNKKDGN